MYPVIMQKSSLGYDKRNFVSLLLMSWVIELIKHFNKDPATFENLPDLPSGFKFSSDFKQLKENWRAELNSGSPSFFRALLKTVWREYAKGPLYLNTYIFLMLVQITLIGRIIDFLKSEDISQSEGLVYVLVSAIVVFIAILAFNRCFFILAMLTGKIKNFITMMVSAKSLNITTSGVLSESGKISNLIGNDIELFELLMTTSSIWLTPLLYGGSSVILFLELGSVGFFPIIFTLFYICVVYFLGKCSTKIRVKIGKHSDSRIKMIMNMIEGLKIVKFYAWEHPLLNKIFRKRKNETKELYKMGLLQMVAKATSFYMNGLTLFVTFYIYVESGNSLTLSKALVSTMVIIFTNTISVFLVTGFRTVFLCKVTCQRITDILLLDEPQKMMPTQVESIKIKRGVFNWDSEHCIRDINFKVSPGELLAVIGPVGSGKTSLLYAMIQELPISEGSNSTGGSISYCPGTPWIIPDTIRENVTVGLEFNPEKYEYALQKSCLMEDLNEIGDQAMANVLSGGQKARLNFARTLYTDKKIVLLDDPLSAVDPEVGNLLFNSILELRSQGKTIILVTNQLQNLVNCDKVLVMDNGKQVFCGSFMQMSANKNIEKLLGKINKQKSQRNLEDTKNTICSFNTTYESQNRGILKVHDREKLRKSIPLKMYFSYFKLAFNNFWLMVTVGVLLLISQGIFSGMYYWISAWSESTDQSDPHFYHTFGLILIGLFVFGFIRYGSVIFGLTRANERLHNESLKAIALTDIGNMDKNSTGKLLSRFVKDMIIVDEPLLHFYSELFHLLLLVIGNILVAALISPSSLLFIFIIIPIFILIKRKVLPITKDLRKIELMTKTPVLNHMNSILSGLVVIRTLGISKHFKKETKRAAVANMRAYMAYHAMLRYIQLVIEFGSLIVISTSALTIVLLKDSISPELGAIALSMTTSLCGLVNYFMKTCIEVENYMVSPQRLFDYTQLPSERTNGTTFEISEGSIDFCNVSMKYNYSLPCSLKNLNVSIPAGRKVGIVGRTGSGKSSILQLLFRMVEPFRGNIYIDGKDYADAGLYQLRKQISVIPQTAFVFEGSLKDNLDPFDEFGSTELQEVLESVGLKEESIRIHESVLDFNFSTGQKQLVCLARAMLRKNKIIVMDEATSNVDRETEKLMQKLAFKEFENCTVLLIAHRLRALLDCEDIIVMDHGTCIETGKLQLLAKQHNSAFRNMIDSAGRRESEFILNQISQKY